MGGLLAKTSRPRLSTVYKRARLLGRLDLARREHSATLVSGPPGAGKTTLISSYVKARNLRTLWYQVDQGDDDVATFFHYFSAAAAEHMPADAAPLPSFDPAIVSDHARFSREYFRNFFTGQAMPLVVVLDNYQQLALASPLHAVVQIACEEAPKTCHVIVATQEACPMPLARMRYNKALAVLGPEDLVLTIEETEGIASCLGVRLAPASAAVLHAQCAGWAMGLLLRLDHAVPGVGEAQPVASLREGNEERVSEYFEGEVFRRLDAGSRDLLLQGALLPKMTVACVNRMTGTPASGSLLQDLAARNHFVTRHGCKDCVYQFHPLFREFLLQQGVLRYPEAALASLRCKAAEALLDEGDHDAAVELLSQASAWVRLAEIILATAPMLRAQGRIATLAAWMEQLPGHMVDIDPWLLYWKGSGKACSDPEQCQQILEKAYRRFSARDDVMGMAMSWVGLMDTIFSIHRDFWQMDAWVAAFNERIKGRLGELPSDLGDRLTLAYFNALSFRQPLHPDMPIWLERVRKMLDCETRAAERPRLRQHLVTYHLLRGEHAEAESVLSMLRYADGLPASQRPARTLTDHISEATVAMNLGTGERGLRAVSEGLRAAEGTGNRLFESVLLQLGAVMSLNGGDLARADRFLCAFEGLAESLPFVDRGAYFAVSAWRRYQAGEPAMALQLLGQAVAASEARGTPYYIAVDNLGLGLLLHLCGKTCDALKHLESGRKVGATIRNPLIEYVYHLFSASVALSTGGEDKAHAHLVSGMRLGRQHGYMHFFYFPPTVIARVCFAALEAGIETGYVRSLIQRNGLEPDPAWRQSEAWPWPLRIYTLGRFGVVKDGTALRFTGKAQKKPLELLKALIAFGGRDVWEGRLADALWPEAEGDAAAQALATTLFRLRKLIGEQAIRRQENRLTLDPAFCWVDCWAFERLSSDESGSTPVRLAKLRKLHQGPFLDGADDAPWAHPMRERLHAKFARLSTMVTSAILFVASACRKDEDLVLAHQVLGFLPL